MSSVDSAESGAGVSWVSEVCASDDFGSASFLASRRSRASLLAMHWSTGVPT